MEKHTRSYRLDQKYYTQHYKLSSLTLRELLTDALTFAKTIIKLDDYDKKIIYHSRKSLLFNQEQMWMKKGGDLFDVSMGACHVPEVCKPVGISY